jgi:hypothetical protein
MDKKRPTWRWAGIVVLGLWCLGGLAWAEQVESKAAMVGKPDQITIRTLAAFQKLELPPVTYFHDKHTTALAKEKKGCDTCHYQEGDRLSFAFKRRQTTKPDEIQDLYHSNCIGCHNDYVAAGKKSGPQDGFCRSCHNAAASPTVARLDAGMDKVLHYRHLASKNIVGREKETENCSACHHVLDQATKKLVYAKGQEGSCRYCHQEEGRPGMPSLQAAAHEQCLNCHRKLSNRGLTSPMPLDCAACHGAEAQAQLAKKQQELVAKLPGGDIPRLQRGQPNATLVRYEGKAHGGAAGQEASLPPVPFNHQAHEKYTDSCRVCHHASMESCSACHTRGGSDKGGFVTFEQAMHRRSAEASCIGCHDSQKDRANCAGCHNSIVQARPANQAQCQLCHMPGASGAAASPQQKAALAESLLQSRRPGPDPFLTGKLPDKVVIKELSKKFQPVSLDHAKHLSALQNGMKDSKLAGYFHSLPGTVCQACHHNSPAAKEPPACVACHAKTQGVASLVAAAEISRPGLQAAYHGQCMSCHKDMGLKPVATACTECHQKKPQQAALSPQEKE